VYNFPGVRYTETINGAVPKAMNIAVEQPLIAALTPV
jgi:hypothetical protein